MTTDQLHEKVLIARGAPYGALYAGALLVLVGLIASVGAPWMLTAVLVVCGVLLICTGLIQRTIHRYR